jgi:low molecular weight protein-tyrosine phosphatase
MSDSHPPDRVLILCTANRCRSVIAAALLAQRLGRAGESVEVRSAGVSGHSGEPPPVEVVSVLLGYGLDVSRHRSRTASPADFHTSSLILGMAREHVRHAAVTAPGSWPRTFTLKEIIRRVGQAEPRERGEPLSSWLESLHAGRDRYALLGNNPADDIIDPIGGPSAAYQVAATEIEHLVRELVTLGWGTAC